MSVINNCTLILCFPGIVHLAVYMCLTFVHSRLNAHGQTLISQNHLREQYHRKKSISMQQSLIISFQAKYENYVCPIL